MSMKNPLELEVNNAINNYIQINGFPPSILEVSNKLEKVELLDLNMVASSVNLPKNIIYVGVSDEETNIRVETQSE